MTVQRLIFTLSLSFATKEFSAETITVLQQASSVCLKQTAPVSIGCKMRRFLWTFASWGSIPLAFVSCLACSAKTLNSSTYMYKLHTSTVSFTHPARSAKTMTAEVLVLPLLEEHSMDTTGVCSRHTSSSISADCEGLWRSMPLADGYAQNLLWESNSLADNSGIC